MATGVPGYFALNAAMALVAQSPAVPTPDGDALFFRLRDAAIAFDQRLRAGLLESETGQLEALLTRLRDNVS